MKVGKLICYYCYTDTFFFFFFPSLQASFLTSYLHELHSFAYNTRLGFHGDIAVGKKKCFLKNNVRKLELLVCEKSVGK